MTSAQMRGIEAAAMASGRVTGLELMERAGRGVVEAILAHWPELGAGHGKAIVLCGPGNNGGDGYVIARLLRARGWEVALHALAPAATADAATMAQEWGGPAAGFEALEWEALRGAAVVVDAVFGTGLTRQVAPGVWGALAMAQEAGARLVAVDILSGLDADSGAVRAEGGYLDHPAALTVTFQAAKLGHHLGAGGSLTGPLVVVDIGLDRELAALDGAVEAAEVSAERLKKVEGHKYSHGHALVLAGGVGRGGAARLAARAALRVGAGLVTLGCEAGAVAENAGRLDAVMLREVAGAEALAAVLQDARISALVAGPGLGLGAREAGLVAAALGGAHRPAVVLDADALTLVAQDATLFALLHDRCVLTPHEGEFARLFPDLAPRLGRGKVEVLRGAAKRAGCVVLLKGADTVIAAADGRCVVHAALRERAAPWLATAGSGDVLAGIICGLVARGWSGFAAAEAAAFLHVEAAREFGPGLIAEDLPEMLPAVFRRLGV
nr:NAD(P)H-hydrate dehydratase [Gemmobacter straminiformis]